VRLFCFPYAGGSAASFHSWTNRLPRGVELWAVQLPGHGNRIRERRFERMEPLCEALTEALAEELRPPFACFGHSLGALIAYELTRGLRRLGRPGPGRLYVSGHRAPHLRSRRGPIHALPEAELVGELLRLDGTAEQALSHPELRELTLPIVRDDFAIAETYAHERAEPLDTPIVAFGGTRDPIVDEDQLLAWVEHTRQSFRVHMLPGGHLFLDTERDAILALLAGDLREWLRTS
jgi:surfactin synthase thioesterase subunit